MRRYHKTAAPILHLITTLDIGGAENHLYSLLTGLPPQQWFPYLLFLKGQGELAAKFRRAGIPTRGMGMQGAFDPGLLLRLYLAIRRLNPCLVHTHLFKADFYGALASRLAGVPVVISSKHNEDPELAHPVYKPLGKLALKLNSAVIAISQAVQQHVLRHTGIPVTKIKRIYYGFDLQAFEQQPATPRLQEESGLKSPLVGMVGRLAPQKDYPVFLQAAARVLQVKPQVTFVIVGRGPQEAWLRQMAQQLGIASQVHFLGFRQDIRRVMSSLDIFVLTSRWEGLGLVLLEAMACQLPVIASDAGAISEVMAPGETGWLIPPADVSGFASAIVRLLDNPPQRKAFGAAGRQRLCAYFQISQMVQQTTALYQACLAQAKKGVRYARIGSHERGGG